MYYKPITIDERGCGQGKTTKRIYKRIESNIQNNVNTLIVVPGINLQEQYLSGIKLPIELINSNIYNKFHYKFKSTVQALINAMKTNENIIIVTHKTFTMLPKDNGYKNNYDLIIDEALEEVIKLSKITYKKSDWGTNLNIEKLFDFSSQTEKEIVDLDYKNDKNWYKLNRVIDDTGITILNESTNFTNITDKNYICYVTSHGYNVLAQKVEGEARVISVLDSHLLVGWKDVLIAAAAFKFTKMYYWLLFNNVKMHSVTEFTCHDSFIRLHTDKTIGMKYNEELTDKKTIIYSNSLIKKHPEIVTRYHDYVNKHRSGKIITIRNNYSLHKLPDEEELSHNVHGLNDYQDITNVNLESALNMDPHKEHFIRTMWLGSMNKKVQDETILHFHSCYLFYQVILRTKLRSMDYDNGFIDVFIPDVSIATSVLEYFNQAHIEIHEMDLLQGLNLNLNPKPNGRPLGTTNPNTMTNAERKRKSRNKNKNT